MRDAGIDDSDLIVVDKAIKPTNGHIVVAVVDGKFTVKWSCPCIPGPVLFAM